MYCTDIDSWARRFSFWWFIEKKPGLNSLCNMNRRAQTTLMSNANQHEWPRPDQRPFYDRACHACLCWCWLHSFHDSAFCIDSFSSLLISIWGLLNKTHHWRNESQPYSGGILFSFPEERSWSLCLMPVSGNGDFIPASPSTSSL